jgi:hypothetical protein
MVGDEIDHGSGFVETTPEERARSHVGWNDWRLMAALLRKVGYAVTEPVAAQRPWRDMSSAPRVQRVLVCYQCGVIEIARQLNHVHIGWAWVSDDADLHDQDDDPMVGWMPLPPAALPLRTDCTCRCHAPQGMPHELPCCRPGHGGCVPADGDDIRNCPFCGAQNTASCDTPQDWNRGIERLAASCPVPEEDRPA